MHVLKWIRFFLPAILYLAAVTAASAIPRVLILGDETYRQPAADVAKALKGQAEVVFVTSSSNEPFTTQTALVKLDEWLGKGKWDLIHFNLGMIDMIYRAPGMKSFRVMSPSAGGVINTPPDEYEKNLREIGRRLSATRAKLIWANTTPVSASLLNIQVPGAEIEYNKIAEKVMTAGRVPINDMNGYCLSLLDSPKKPMDRKARRSNTQSLHVPIIAAICRELRLRLPPKSDE